MLRAARRAVINGSFVDGSWSWSQGSARINVKRTTAEPWARAPHATVAACLGISQPLGPLKRRLSKRWLDQTGPTGRAGEEQLLLDVAGSSLCGLWAGSQAGWLPTATPSAFSQRHMKASTDSLES